MTPRRVSAETAITGGRWRSLRLAMPAISSRSGSAMSHLFTAMTVAQLRRVASVQIERSSSPKRMVASTTMTATCARSRLWTLRRYE